MPSLYKRSNGIYYYSFKEDGKWKCRSTGQRQKPAALKELVSFQPRQVSKPKTTFQTFTRDFLSYAETTYSARTLAMYKSILQRLSVFIGDKFLTSITAKDIDLYRTHRLKEISPVSVNIELRTLRAAFYTALRWKLVEENPFKGVPLLRIPDQLPTYFGKEDFQKLLSVIAEGWFKEFTLIAVCTGLRRAELLNLTWKDVDFERRLIQVQSKEGFKTKAGKRRTMPMSEVVYQLLWSKAQLHNCAIQAGQSVNDFIFTVDGKKIAEDLVTHKFKAYVRKVGLDPKLHFHSLRHTFATWLVQEGVSIYEVQKLLGHSSISVTQIYSHLAASELHGAVNKISIPLN